MYPNPLSNQLIVETSNSEILPFTIYNLQGKLAVKGLIEQGVNTINITTMNPGIYFLKINTIDFSLAIKIIKE